MKRTPLYRKPPRRRVRAVRPGVTPAMPKGWRATCLRIIERDAAICRNCGQFVRVLGWTAAVDHILPRRLFESGAAASADENLATLCAGRCHALKTQVIEPALYGGDLLAFDTYCKRLATTGPVPGEAMRAAAFARLMALVYGPTTHTEEAVR